MTNQNKINAHHGAIRITEAIINYETQVDFMTHMKRRSKTDVDKASLATKILESKRQLKILNRSYDRIITQLTKTK